MHRIAYSAILFPIFFPRRIIPLILLFFFPVQIFSSSWRKIRENSGEKRHPRHQHLQSRRAYKGVGDEAVIKGLHVLLKCCKFLHICLLCSVYLVKRENPDNEVKLQWEYLKMKNTSLLRVFSMYYGNFMRLLANWRL